MTHITRNSQTGNPVQNRNESDLDFALRLNTFRASQPPISRAEWRRQRENDLAAEPEIEQVQAPVQATPPVATEPPTNQATLMNWYLGVATASELNWLPAFGHPYAFHWADEVFREQVIHWLTCSDTRQTDYAAKDLLRWLLYRFRVAQRRRVAMPPDAAPRRWIWATHAEVTQATGLSESQIRRAVDRMEARGLVRHLSDYALNYVPHYRPSGDLFRFCRIVTLHTDPDCVAMHAPEYEPVGEYEKFLRKAHGVLTTAMHSELREAVEAFARGEAGSRVAVFTGHYNKLLGKATEAAEDAE